MARVIQMSDRELTRLRVMIDLADDRLTVDAAATLMGLGRRQIYRLRRIFSADGPAGLASRKRGRPSNRKRGETFRATVLSLVREHYVDFGPTLAAEKLSARHGLRIGVETLRQWMMAEGLWVDRRHKLPSPHQPRRRRECLGELVQIDGSEHRWFENRGETCTLLAFVDDATSRLMQLRFVVSESAFDYFRATKDYLETHGKPVAFYSDKHGIFRVNAKDARIGGDRITQFGRVLSELNIDIICANSPQAKGRVERAFGTLVVLRRAEVIERGLGDDEPQLHQSAGRVVDERQQSTCLAAVLEPAMLGTVDLHEFAQTFPPSSRLMRGGQFVAAVDPQPLRHHPLPQCLDADPQTVTCAQFFRRQRRSEIDVMFAHQAQQRGAEGLATLAVAWSAAFARRQAGRTICRKYPAEAVNLTPTQPHQRRRGIHR